jgi:hypothetical protein
VYECGCWTVKAKKDKDGVTAAEIKFMRRKAKYIRMKCRREIKSCGRNE